MVGFKQTLKNKIKAIESYCSSYIDMLSNHRAELAGLGFTLAYCVALAHYYSNSTFRELAEGGLTTTGKWISKTPVTYPEEHSLEAFKPWFMPALPPPDSFGSIHLTTRHLLPIIENDCGGVLPGWILSIGKCVMKSARYLKRALFGFSARANDWSFRNV